MVMPPDNTGDEFPDFENMSPEEQMAWLESLARRQGVGDDQLTTAADLDIPLPENAKIDEPGYVPFEGSRSAREMQERADVSIPEPEQESEPRPADVEMPVEDAFDDIIDDVIEMTEAPTGNAFAGGDPMHWFDTLAVQPSEGGEALDIVDDLFNLDDDVEPELFADVDDFSTDEIQGLFGATDDKIEPDIKAARAARDYAEDERVLADLFGTDELDDAERMEWFETLAKRQGARDEELLTPADVDVPEMPADTVVDEPGYVEYSPLSILPPRQFSETLEEMDELASIADFEDDMAGGELAWLEDVAAEPDEDIAEFLAFDDDVVARHADEVEVPVSASDDPLAGMSDEDVARAQAQGTLTPSQELAWLKRQARALAAAREAEELAMQAQELPPAEPGEIPDWLETIRQTAEQEEDALANRVLDDAGLTVDDEAIEALFGGDVDTLWEDDLAEQEIPELEQLISDSELTAFVSDDRFGSEPDSAEMIDQVSERHQDETVSEPEWYTESVANSAAGAAELAELEAGQDELAADDVAGEPMLVAAELVDGPGWLDDVESQEEIQDAVAETVADDDDSDMPAWLRSVEDASSAGGIRDAMPDWLDDETAEATPLEVEAEMMASWLFENDQEVGVAGTEAVEPAVESDAERVVGESEPEFVIPDDSVLSEEAIYAQFRERLDSAPDDHAHRLALARALRSNRIVDAALDQYEVLVEVDELLPDVSNDLTTLLEIAPEEPRTQRLLGDTFMRRGMLAEALAAYRNALHRL